MAHVKLIFIWIIAYASLLSCYSEVAQDNVIFTNQQCPEGQEGVFYAVDKSPTQYKHCGPAGFFWIFPCSPGTYFNQVEQACLLPANATTTTNRNQIVTTALTRKSPITTTLRTTAVTTTVLRMTSEFVTVPTTTAKTITTTFVPMKTTVQELLTPPVRTMPATKKILTPAMTTEMTHLTSIQSSHQGEHEKPVDEEHHEHTTIVPTFSAVEPKLFVTAGPHMETEDYYETYDAEHDLSHSHSPTLKPSHLIHSTPPEVEYWGDNTAESPPIPLHPRISNHNVDSNANMHEKDHSSALGNIHGVSKNAESNNGHQIESSSVSSNSNLDGTNNGEQSSTHTAQSPPTDIVNVETSEDLHTSFVPLEYQPPVNHHQPDSSGYDKEHIYEYHVVPPPTDAYEVTEPPPHESAHEEQPHPTHTGEPIDSQQPVKHYESGSQSAAVHQPGFAWSSYESGTYMEPHSQHQIKESEQSVPPPIYSHEYYVNPTEPHPMTQAEYPQDENAFIRTVPPDPIQPKISQHNQESLILRPQSETYVTPYASNNVRTFGGPKSLPKAVTLSPMAMELKKRISDEDLASMQRVFLSIAAQGGGGPGGPQMPPNLPRGFPGGNGPPNGFSAGNMPPGYAGGRPDYSQFIPSGGGYFPHPVRPPPITEIPPTIIMVPSCKENGTCEFNAVIETYCMHESDPTYYYQCGPSADEIGIWMMRQCPAGLQLNSEGQCGKRQKGGSGVKNPSPQPVSTDESSPSIGQDTSGWSQQNVQQPLENYEEHSTDTQPNIYPVQIANPGVTQPAEQPNVNPKQSTYTNVEIPYQPSIQTKHVPSNVRPPPRPHQLVVYPKPIQTVPQIRTQPVSQEQTVDNNYQPNLPSPYQTNQQSIYSTGNTDQVVPPANYGQYPRTSINEINNPGSVDPASFVNSLKTYANQNGNDMRPAPATHYVVDQQQTKNPYIQPRFPYQPPKSITTIVGGSLPQAVIAKLANLDNLAQAIAVKNVYNQGQQMVSSNQLPKSTVSQLPYPPGQNPFSQFGSNYLSAGQPQLYSQPAQNMNGYQYSNFNGNTAGTNPYNMQNRIIMPKSISYGMNPNQAPNNPRYPYPDSRPYSTSRDATPLAWHSSESVDKPNEPVYVWRPAAGQRCSLLASPKAQVFSNPDDYKSFFMCTLRQGGGDSPGKFDPNEGTWALLQCPEDTIFNTSLKVCDRSLASHLKQRKLPK